MPLHIKLNINNENQGSKIGIVYEQGWVITSGREKGDRRLR
jgi:hypothetical protein